MLDDYKKLVESLQKAGTFKNPFDGIKIQPIRFESPVLEMPELNTIELRNPITEEITKLNLIVNEILGALNALSPDLGAAVLQNYNRKLSELHMKIASSNPPTGKSQE